MIRFGKHILTVITFVLVGSTYVDAQEVTTHVHEGMVENFLVEVWVDRGEASVYYPGERIRVYFRPSHDCFIVVYSIDTEGYIRVLYPYDYDDDPFVNGGRTRRIPDAWDHHDLLVNGPSGIEYIVAVGSTRPIHIPRWRRYYDTYYEPIPDIVDHITGDPYEGMLRMTDLIIPVEYRNYGYVTTSTYFYVERRVWYPRYMCYDCHWPRPMYFHPYVDVCVGFEVVIIDYDWYDDWAYWRPHHPPVRYRQGCWTVRRRDRFVSTTYRTERYSRRRGFKNIGFSKTDVEPVDREKIRKELRQKTKGEKRRGTEQSDLPTRAVDTYMRKDIGLDKSPPQKRGKYESKPEHRRDEIIHRETKPQQKSYSDDVKKKDSRSSNRQQNLWEKITDWSKKGKSAPSISKSKSAEQKSSKPAKVTSPSERKSSSKGSTQKKSNPSKRRRKE